MKFRNAIKMTLLTASAVVCIELLSYANAQDAAPTTAPTTAPSAADVAPGAAPAARGPEVIVGEIQAAMQGLQGVISGPQDLINAEKRAAAAPKAIPVFKKVLGLADELKASGGMGANMADRIKDQFLPVLVAFGDADSVASLETAAKGADKDAALKAQSSLLLGNWWKAGTDAAAQTKLLETATELAKANPSSDELTSILGTMAEVGAASDEIKTKVQTLVSSTMTSEAAKQISQQAEAEAKLKSVENKPAKLAGPTYDGQTFDIASLKGKVVLVDFWATWCGPCRGETPRLIETYKKYKDQGFELIGVSCDENAEDIAKYVKENPGYATIHLFDTKNPGWHAIAKDFGIQGIPTMLLIDKKGIVRTVNARENMDEMIPKLLAE